MTLILRRAPITGGWSVGRPLRYGFQNSLPLKDYVSYDNLYKSVSL